MKVWFFSVCVFLMLLVSCGTTHYQEIGFGGNQAEYSTRKWENPRSSAVAIKLDRSNISKVDSIHHFVDDGNSHFDMLQHNLTGQRHLGEKTTKMVAVKNLAVKVLSGTDKPKILRKMSVLRKLKTKFNGERQGYSVLSWTFFVAFLWVLGISLVCLVVSYGYISSGAFLAGGLATLFLAIWLYQIGVFLFYSSFVLAFVALVLKLLS